MRIAEDPDDSRTRAESRKAIRIPQPARAERSSHAPIMPDSCPASPVFPPAAGAGSRVLRPLFSPTRFHEDPEMIVDSAERSRSAAGARATRVPGPLQWAVRRSRSHVTISASRAPYSSESSRRRAPTYGNERLDMPEWRLRLAAAEPKAMGENRIRSRASSASATSAAHDICSPPTARS